MTDRHYKSGPPREQGLLLPPTVEDYVTRSNPVRAIDAYVDSLDLEKLGFTNSQGKITKGHPAYNPADLLKLYLYGYLNRVRSSRRLEQETYRNLEVIWLLKSIHPSYKTIADFRKNNLSAIKSVNRDFVLLCKELELFGGQLVGIDGSFFKGNASRGSIKTKQQLKKQLKKIEANIARFLEKMDEHDNENDGQSSEDEHLQEKLAKLQEHQKSCQEKLNNLEKTDQTQLSSTDKDTRLLTKRGQTTAGYNVQYAVDEKHTLLVDCDVVQDGNDTQQLYPMAKKAKEVLEAKKLEVVVDSGHFNQVHLKDCQDEGVTPYAAIPQNKNSSEKSGRFGREEFSYIPERDEYQCPAGAALKRQGRQQKDGKILFKYVSKSSSCSGCALKVKCLPQKTPYRQIFRWEHEEVVEAHQDRMRQKGREYMKKRAGLAEHPFGFFKICMGWTHFLMRGLEKVSPEMNLLMLSYNFKRVLNIIGLDAIREYCLQREVQRTRKHSDNPGNIDFFTLFILAILIMFIRYKKNLKMKVMRLRIVSWPAWLKFC